jgi:hypothetical protein
VRASSGLSCDLLSSLVTTGFAIGSSIDDTSLTTRVAHARLGAANPKYLIGQRTA